MIPSFWKEVISEEEKTCCLTYVYDYSIKTTVQIPEEYEGYRVVKVDDEVWGKLRFYNKCWGQVKNLTPK